MKRCPTCNGLYSNHEAFCPQDGQSLETKFVLDEKYQMEQVIGQGGMGQVYRATHIHIGTPVAVKVLKPDLVSDPVLVERFRREARAAAQIRHPNAVLVTDFGVERDSGMVYLVMEFLEGVSLKSRIEHLKRLTPDEVLLVLGQVCSALHVAHTKGIVHRDIKPDNIFLAQSDNGTPIVKVLDFGIAKLRKNFQEGDGSTITQTGTILGTPWYMSPEQCKAEDLDARSDIYSLGVMTYQMLTGTVPFRGPGFSKIMMQHCSEAPPSMRRLVREIPAAVDLTILRSLEKKPAKRQQNVTEFYEQLQTAFSKVGILPLSTDSDKASGERKRSGSFDLPPKTVPAVPMPSGKKPALAGTPTGAAPAHAPAVTAKEAIEEVPTEDFNSELMSTMPPPDTPVSARESQTVISSGLTRFEHPPFPEGKAETGSGRKPKGGRGKLIVATVIGAMVLLAGGIGLMNGLNRPATSPGVKPATPAKNEPPAGMVYVPGGTLIMGNNNAQDKAEKPEHEFPIKPFFLDRLEVTNEAFQKFVQARGYPAPLHWKNGQIPPGEEKFPVTNIRWEDAQAYALWVGKRLPTEEEWEWAAHGEQRRIYPWGNEMNPAFANTQESRKNQLMPVGSFPGGASPCGALDLIGNAAEWTVSDYVPYQGSQAKAEPGQKIIRGGGFGMEQTKATTTKRFLAEPGTRDGSLGFRCASDLPPDIPPTKD